MKKIFKKSYYAFIVLIIYTTHGVILGQSTTLGNNWTPFNYLGYNNTNGISPLVFKTNATDRMFINGNKSATINGYAAQFTGGFVGIGSNSAAQGFPFNAAAKGPFSLLHLNSGIGGFVQDFGWRPWMKYGITSTHNQDLMFIGQRATGGLDVTDVVIGWADNGGPGSFGPDNMVFNFLTGGAGGTDDLLGTALNGREIMRLTGYGNVGVGPRFDNTWQPQSTLHQHQENSQPSWMQISNQLSGGVANAAGPTNIQPTDGLRWGINGANTGYFYNQENNHLLFSTNTSVTGGDRMRITHIGAPGTTNPGNLAANITRVSISQDPNSPVTRPLSLLHIGYNTQGATNDGWRPWMNVGMFVSQSSDNVFLGLKDESTTIFGDKFDAVLSWGDNQVNTGLPPNNGPDNFRFIFTSTTAGTGGGTPPATGANGLEGMRLTPTLANGVYTGVGGAPTNNPYTAGQNPGNTMEVNSWGATNVPGGSSGLRFTNLNTTSPVIANPGLGVLSVNTLGDVIYVPGGAAAQLGNICGAATQNPLTNNWEIPLNGHNYIFSGNNLATDRVGIGNITSCSPIAKLHVENLTGFGGAKIAGYFRNTGTDNNSVGYIGIAGISNVTGSSLLGNVGGSFSASGAHINNTGVRGTSSGNANANYGGSFTATGATFQNFGIYASASSGSNNWAGYFNGNVFINGVGTSPGPGLIFSDKNLKQNIVSVLDPMDIILRLRPVSYNMNNGYAPQLNVDVAKTYGFIAQEVSTIIPELVKDVVVPASYDSLGTTLTPSVTVKSLNYTGLIPFAISGIQQLDKNQKAIQAQLDKAGLSDQQVKTNVNNFNALAKIKTLNPVSYNFTNANVPQLTFKPNTEYGFIAQQLQTVYPELVDTVRIAAKLDSVGNIVNPAIVLKTVNYKAMSALLVRSVQELQFKIDSLTTKLAKQDSINNRVQDQLAALAAQINGCCSNATGRMSNTQTTVNSTDVELSDKDAIVLNQNVPNPFAEQTSISYNVPESVGRAQIIFYNSAGQIIQTVDIKTRGKGKVNVFASDLSSGLYHYTLVADGKVIDSKKMVRE